MYQRQSKKGQIQQDKDQNSVQNRSRWILLHHTRELSCTGLPSRRATTQPRL
jgi:hypothetical protein